MHRYLLAFSFLLGCAEPPDTVSVAEHELELAPLPPLYQLRIQAIATADSDGGNASPVSAATISNLLPDLNKIFSSTRIQILFDPATDFVQKNNTLLNQRFQLLAGVDPADYHDEDVAPPTSRDWHDLARRFEADNYRDKLTIFFASPDELVYSEEQGHWIVQLEGGGGSSSRHSRSVAWRRSPDAASLAHEMGHYLHQQHTMVKGVGSIAEAADKIAAYLDAGHAVADGLLALDPDTAWVLDTPPDAAGSIIATANDPNPNDDVAGDKCGPVGSVQIPVTYGNNQHHTFTLEPDRSLVMSYFKGCPFDQHFSSDQRTRILEAATLMNRRNILEYVPAPQTSPTPELAYLDYATAGAISEVKMTRLGVNRVVTVAIEGISLKLIVWDVGTGLTDGDITRRGEIVVGELGGGPRRSFAITHGGLRQVIVSYRDLGGGLTLKSFEISSAGTPSLQGTETAGEIADVAIARIDPITFVTPVRLATGVLRTIAWRIYANGTIKRLGHGDGGTIDGIEGVTAYTPDGLTGEDIEGAATIFVKTGGNLAVQTWEVHGDWSVVMADSESAGAIVSSAVSSLDFDLAATTVTSTSNVQKVIAWKSSYSGTITRGGSASIGSCLQTTSAPIGTRYLATACRRPADNAQIVRLYEISAGGATVTLKHEQESGTGTELAMAEVGSNKVFLATRSTSGRLVVKTFEVTP
jgi:hypothetical protein